MIINVRDMNSLLIHMDACLHNFLSVFSLHYLSYKHVCLEISFIVNAYFPITVSGWNIGRCPRHRLGNFFRKCVCKTVWTLYIWWWAFCTTSPVCTYLHICSCIFCILLNFLNCHLLFIVSLEKHNEDFFTSIDVLVYFFRKSITGLMFVIRLTGCTSNQILPFLKTGLVWQKPWGWYV